MKKKKEAAGAGPVEESSGRPIEDILEEYEKVRKSLRKDLPKLSRSLRGLDKLLRSYIEKDVFSSDLPKTLEKVVKIEESLARSLEGLSTKSFESAMSSLNDRVTSLMESLDGLASRVDEMGVRLEQTDELQRRMDDINATLSDIRSVALPRLDAGMEGLRTQIGMLEHALDEVRAQGTGEMSGETSRITESTSRSIEMLTRSVEDLEKRVSESEERMRDIREALEDGLGVADKVGALEETVKKHVGDPQIAKISASLSLLEKKLDAHEEECASSFKRTNEIESLVRHLNERLTGGEGQGETSEHIRRMVTDLGSLREKVLLLIEDQENILAALERAGILVRREDQPT